MFAPVCIVSAGPEPAIFFIPPSHERRVGLGQYHGIRQPIVGVNTFLAKNRGIVEQTIKTFVNQYICVEINTAAMQKGLQPDNIRTMCRMRNRITKNLARSSDFYWRQYLFCLVPPASLRLILKVEERLVCSLMRSSALLTQTKWTKLHGFPPKGLVVPKAIMQDLRYSRH